MGEAVETVSKLIRNQWEKKAHWLELPLFRAFLHELVPGHQHLFKEKINFKGREIYCKPFLEMEIKNEMARSEQLDKKKVEERARIQERKRNSRRQARLAYRKSGAKKVDLSVED